MNVLVAGGSGYIGSVLVRKLVEQGDAVHVVDRCFLGDHVGYLDGVRLLMDDTRQAYEGWFYGIDRVVDLAGLSNDPACELDPALTVGLNFHGGVRLASMARVAGVPSYTYVSSCAVYGRPGSSFRCSEITPVSPRTEYARSKALVERAIHRLWGREGLILRLGTAYGLSPRMRFDLAPNLMALCGVQRGVVEVWGAGDQWRPFVHVSDVVRLLSDAEQLDHLREGAGSQGSALYNIGSDQSTLTAMELADIVASATGARVDVQPERGEDVRSYRPSFALLAATGFKPRVSLAEGVKQVVDAIRSGAVEAGPTSRTVDVYKDLVAAGLQW